MKETNTFSLKNWEMSLIYKDTFYFKKKKNFITSVGKYNDIWEINVYHVKSCNLMYSNNSFDNLEDALIFAETKVCPSFH